ncbi:MAG: hypothetical protein HGA27_02775 [Peptococcaceae bacterium]|nr:hypothetical protein [Peptococcaceae bacterium]
MMIVIYYLWQKNRKPSELTSQKESNCGSRVNTDFTLGKNKWELAISLPTRGISLVIELDLNKSKENDKEPRISKIKLPYLSLSKNYKYIRGTSKALIKKHIKAVNLILIIKDSRGKRYELSYEIDMAEIFLGDLK